MVIKNYDLPPEALSKEQKEQLKKLIKNQLTKAKVTSIYFFSPRLLQSFAYLDLLRDYPAKKFLVTSLKDKTKAKKKSLI